MLRQYLFSLLFVLGLILATCTIQTPEETSEVPTVDSPLTIWWNKGYFAQENQSIKKIVSDWQQKTHIPVKIEIISEDDIDKQTIAALNKGNPPDILFSMRTDSALSSRWAWEGKLADVSEVLEPLKDTYSPIALKSVYMYDNTAKHFAYYAVPFEQNSVHLHYWRDLLNDAGFQDSDIPQEWESFWDFWKQAQDNLRDRGRKIYGLALSMSPEATNDTFYAFEQFLEAYNIRLVDEKGKLQLDKPEVRQGLIKTLNWVTNFYRDGYVSPESVKWRGSDNNIEFLNQNAIMINNTTMSIPSSQRKDKNTYLNDMVTTAFPTKPDGTKITYLVAIKQLLVFAKSKHKQAAKDFLSYFVQPETLKPYFKSAAGR
ncbi:MAG: ABC transporter substrate-binding protein, partial [Prochloraceae cyanobacterium]